MSKQEFLMQLRKGLSGLPQADIEERVTFYSEMIDDRMEEGLSEEEAVSAAGKLEELIPQIVSEIPLSKLVKERVTPKEGLRPWQIVLLVLGAPIWFSLLIAALSLILSLYVLLWSLIVSLWAIFCSFAGGALGGVFWGVGAVFGGRFLRALMLVGTALVCAGLAIFLLFGCKAATKGALRLTKRIALFVKNCFMTKEEH